MAPLMGYEEEQILPPNEKGTNGSAGRAWYSECCQLILRFLR